MAEADEDFGSLDDNLLLQAYEDYQQQQDDGGTSSSSSAVAAEAKKNQPGNAIDPNNSKVSPSDNGHQASCSSKQDCDDDHKTRCQLDLKVDAKMETTVATKIINLGNGTTLEIHVDRKQKRNGDEHKNSKKNRDQSLFSLDDIETLSFTHLLRSRWVNASDLSQQEWCEQQMIYNLNAKFGFVPIGVQVEEVELTTPAMKGGTKFHDKKDKEVNSYVPVAANTQEDKFAVKLLNTIQSIKRLVLLGEPCIREVDVFGMPYDYGILVMGKIDELRFNEHEQLELVDFKTRETPRPPGKAQVRTHHLQVMVYKQLVDDLVSGAVYMNAVLAKMRLDPQRLLNEDLLVHARSLDIPAKNLGEVMAYALDQFRFLPKVGSMVMEYYLRGEDDNKDNKLLLSKEHVEFKEAWFKKRLDSHFGFWRGEKEVDGPDIEELWKCNKCQFVNGCEWRQKKNEECLKKNNSK